MSREKGLRQAAVAMAETTNLDQLFHVADSLLTRSYLTKLSQAMVRPVPDDAGEYRFYRVERLAYEKDEDNQQKLLNVYQALHASGTALAVLLDSDSEGISLYLGVRDKDHNAVSLSSTVLSKSMQGNFPGVRMEHPVKDGEMREILAQVTDEGRNKKAVAAITSVAGARDMAEKSQQKFVQGLEKLIEAMRGEKYSLLLIADAISGAGLMQVKSGLEGLYSSFYPFRDTVLTYGRNEGKSVAHALNKAVSEGFSENMSRATSQGVSDTESHSTTNTVGIGAGGILKGVGIGANVSHGATNGTSHGTTFSDTETSGAGRNTGTTMSKGRTEGFTAGQSESYQIHSYNKSVSDMLEQIDTQLERIRNCQDQGMWHFGAYVIAASPQTAQVVASTYQSLVRGVDSGNELATITMWKEDNPRLARVLSSLRTLHHPVFGLGGGLENITAATRISSEELTVAAALPQESVPGLPVRRYASFGREVAMSSQGQPGDGRKITLGNVFNKGITEAKKVDLSLAELTAHSFVTGTTGSGKSNTIYMLLKGLMYHSVKWLVIEPAKGEYKDVFGGRSDVEIYGTNPRCYPHMLQLNPFAFPDEVHVLEHIDRLVEIFGACWPLYAAMPAILREAIESAYETCGWNLRLSVNVGVFPTFADLLEALPRVIERSEYASDTTSDYKGALVTRVRSLTRGLHGMVFEGEDCFDQLLGQNTVVDISRIGSQETKSLLMGILVMKLQEYRMSHKMEANSRLQHVTVLEEAHNLLRRTSMEQSQEGANLQGKSVEMIANAAAEMRTYGEGFVFADQSPALLDPSVIRNTNTKIIMRLPSIEDREIAGGAIGLSEVQREEISKLDCGVAVVYQGLWEEPVLCRISHFAQKRSMLERYKSSTFAWKAPETAVIEKILAGMMTPCGFTPKEKDLAEQCLRGSGLSFRCRKIVHRIIQGEQVLDWEKFLVLCYLAGGNADGATAFASVVLSDEQDGWNLLNKKLMVRWGVKMSPEFRSEAQNIFASYRLAKGKRKTDDGRGGNV